MQIRLTYEGVAVKVQSNQLIDIATRDVTCLSAEATLGEAAHIMAQRRFSSVVVTDAERHPLGIVTERNILRAMHEGALPQMPLHEAMSAPVIVMTGDTDSLDAYQTCLRKGIRHLVLVDDAGLVCGVVSETDFRLHFNLTALAGRRKISAIAKRAGIALPSNTPLVQALDLMHEQHKSCAVVVEQEKPIGIVTERDVVRFYARNPNWRDVLLGEVMVSPVLTILHSATTAQAAELMVKYKVRHLVSVDENGHLAGILSEHDLTQAMLSGLSEERAGIEESFLRTLINTLPDLVWLKDTDGVYLACNARFEQLFGVAEQSLLGKTDYDFVDPGQADSFREHDRKAMLKGAPSVNEEWLNFAADGYRGLFETIKTPMHDNRGRLVGVLGVAREITERDRIDQMLHQRQLEFSTLAENAPQNIVRYGRDCRAVYVNPRMLRTLNVSAQAMLYKRPTEVVAGADSEVYEATLRRVIEQNVEQQLEIHMPDASGKLTYQSIRFVPELNQSGEVVGALAMGTDVTEFREIEQALRQSLELTEGVINAIPDLLFELDRHGRYINIWAHEAALLAAQKELLLGRTVSEVLPAAVAETVMSAIAEAEANGTASGQIISLELPNGKRWFELSTAVKSQARGEHIQRFIMLSRDVTRRKQVEQQKEEYMSLLNATLESSTDAILVVDLNNKWTLYNRNFLELWRIPLEIAASGNDLAALSYVIDRLEAPEPFLSKVQELYAAPDISSFDVFNFKDGSIIERYSIPQRVAGKVVGRVWSFRDVTERKRAEESLRITASVFDTSQEGILITDADNRIIDVNPAFTTITGYSRHEALGNTPRMLGSGRQSPQFYAEMWRSIREKKSWRGEIWNRRKSGEVYAELLSISAICDEAGEVQRHVGVFSDITYFKDHEAELSHVANYDALTGIPNRRLLADRLAQAIAQAQRNGKLLAICYLDLDGFKEVNDHYGHNIGDELLIEITRRLQEELRAGDTLARLGGDEFVLLLNELTQEAECFQILERFMQTISAPVQLEGHGVAVSVSIGVAFYLLAGETGDTLLRHADQAMYVAKQAGKNRIHCHGKG